MRERQPQLIARTVHALQTVREDWRRGGGLSVALRRTAWSVSISIPGFGGIGAGEGYGISKLSEFMGYPSPDAPKLFAITAAALGVVTGVAEGMTYPLRAGRALRRGIEPPPVIYPIRVPFPHQY